MEIPEVPLKDLKNVTDLFLVDASREDRIGELSEILKQNPRPRVEVYDHHPDDQATISADVFHTACVGATTTIVVHELMQKKTDEIEPLSTFEASILLAGIYEDTANFLSTGTTPEDFTAALWLVKQGAEIPIVNRLLTHRLQPGQVDFFSNELCCVLPTIHSEDKRHHRYVLQAGIVCKKLISSPPIMGCSTNRCIFCVGFGCIRRSFCTESSYLLHVDVVDVLPPVSQVRPNGNLGL